MDIPSSENVYYETTTKTLKNTVDKKYVPHII